MLDGQTHCESTNAEDDDDRAARVINISAVRPALRATSVRKMGAHHSAGILSLCGHLRTPATPAPISAASASGEGHSAMMSRNVETAVGIESSLGQSVLNGKANLSYDCGIRSGEDWGMGKDRAASAYRADFIKRVKAARAARPGLTQAAMAKLLDTTQDHYKQFEGRSLLPHAMVEKFCIACGVDIEWLVTGTGKGPAIAPKPQERKEKPTPAARRASAR